MSESQVTALWSIYLCGLVHQKDARCHGEISASFQGSYLAPSCSFLAPDFLEVLYLPWAGSSCLGPAPPCPGLAPPALGSSRDTLSSERPLPFHLTAKPAPMMPLSGGALRRRPGMLWLWFLLPPPIQSVGTPALALCCCPVAFLSRGSAFP